MNKLLELAKTRLGCGYVWGSQGELLTPEQLQRFKNTHGASHYEFGSVSASKWLTQPPMQVFDCSGLVVWCLRQLQCISPTSDYNADGLYRLCTPVSRSDLKKGDLVFIGTTKDFTHVGIYAGGNDTVEAMSTSKGVVVGSISRFSSFGRLRFSLDDNYMPWTDIVRRVADIPDQWENAINIAVNAANADGDLGALEIFKFLPTLIEKIYNSK